MKRFHHGYLILSGLLLLWLVAFGVSGIARFYSGAVLAYFAGGVSDFKPFFALIWLFLCALLLSYRRLPPVRIFLPAWTVGCVFVSQLNSFIIHLWFCWKFQIGLFDSVLISTSREISTNQLIHIHASKGVLYLLLQLFSREEVQTLADPGRAFTEELPRILFIAHGVLVLACLILLLLALRQVYGQWQVRFRIAFAAAYAVASGTVLRCILDGGPFDWNNLSLAPVLVVLLLWPSLRPAQIFSRILQLEIVSMLLLWGLHLYAGTPRWLGVLSNSALSLLFVLVLGLVILAFSDPIARIRWSMLSLVAFAVLATMSTNTYWSWEFRRARVSLKKGNSVYIEDYYDRFRDIPEIAREGKLVLRGLVLPEATRVQSIYSTLGLKIGIDLITTPGHGCNPQSSYDLSGKVKVLEGELQSREFPQPLFNQFTLLPCGSQENCTYRYKANVKGCVPNNVFEVVVNRLTEIGLKKFILKPDRE